MTPWYVKTVWWIIGIWAAGALMYSCDPHGIYSGPATLPEYNYYEETTRPDGDASGRW